MDERIKEFRDGISALRTRRFGTVAELMSETLYRHHASRNQFRDRYDTVTGTRIEIKFFHVHERKRSLCFRTEPCWEMH